MAAISVSERGDDGVAHIKELTSGLGVEVKRAVRQDVGPGWLGGGGRRK